MISMSISKKIKDDLFQIATGTIRAVSEIGLTKYIGDLCSVLERMVSNNFKIAITGSFMNGRTTLINALVGENIYPLMCVFPTPCITKTEFGKEKSARIVLRDPIQQNYLDNIDKSLKTNIFHDKSGNVSFLDIDIYRIGDYLHGVSGQSIEWYEEHNPFERVEIRYPVDLLKDDVILFDTFGINECAVNDDNNISLFHEVDSIIFVLDSTRACSETEMDFIKGFLLPMGFKDIIFVVNRKDLIRSREREAVYNFINWKVSDFTRHEISFISALQALEGKGGYDDMNGEKLSSYERKKRIEKSGITQFETLLRNHISDRHRIKVRRCARELDSIINQRLLNEEIPVLEHPVMKELEKNSLLRCKENLSNLAHRLEEILSAIECQTE